MSDNDVRELRAATVGQRCLAGLIDAVPIASLATAAAWGIITSDSTLPEMPPWNLIDQVADYLVQRPGRALACLGVTWLVWTFWMVVFRGATPGRRVLGLKWLNAQGYMPSRVHISMAMLVLGPLMALGGLSFWWAWVDKERRSLSERFCKLWLVETEHGRSRPRGA